MYRISALTSEYNLMSNIIFSLLLESIPELNELNIEKKEIRDDYILGVQMNSPKRKITIYNIDMEVTLMPNAIHFICDGIENKNIIGLLNMLNKTNIFNRYGVEKSKVVDNPFKDDIIFDINLIKGGFKRTIVKTCEDYKYNEVEGIRKNEYFEKYKEVNTILGERKFQIFIDNIGELINGE